MEPSHWSNSGDYWEAPGAASLKQITLRKSCTLRESDRHKSESPASMLLDLREVVVLVVLDDEGGLRGLDFVRSAVRAARRPLHQSM